MSTDWIDNRIKAVADKEVKMKLDEKMRSCEEDNYRGDHICDDS